MVQMTRDVSFGPILAIATLPVVYFVGRNLHVQYDFSLVKKNAKKKRKKTHLGPKQHIWHCLGPLLLSHPSLLSLLCW